MNGEGGGVMEGGISLNAFQVLRKKTPRALRFTTASFRAELCRLQGLEIEWIEPAWTFFVGLWLTANQCITMATAVLFTDVTALAEEFV